MSHLRLLPGGGLEHDPDRPWTPESNIRTYMRMVGIPYVRLAPPIEEPDPVRVLTKVALRQVGEAAVLALKERRKPPV